MSAGALELLSPPFLTTTKRLFGAAMDSEGKNLYFTASGEHGVLAFTRASATGKLTSLGEYGGSGAEGSCAVHPNNEFFYSTNAVTNVALQFSRNLSTGALTPLAPATVETSHDPVSIAISPNGKWFYVACETGVPEHPMGVTWGTVGEGTGLLTVSATVNLETPAQGPSAVAVSSDSKFLYVGLDLPAEAPGNVRQYQINAVTGAPEALAPEAAGSSGNEIQYGMCISGDGKSLYAVAGPTVLSFTRNEVTGLLTAATSASILHSPGHQIASTSTGNGIYSSCSAVTEPGVFQFSRNAATSVLTALAPKRVNVPSAWGVAVSPDNKNVYVGQSIESASKVYQFTTEAKSKGTPYLASRRHRGFRKPA
jgi:6-phosphogluconolactonase (cycloisomerase 2 family)